MIGSTYSFQFHEKFFSIEAKFTLAKLTRIRQHLYGDLNTYMKKFHERGPVCYNPGLKETLVGSHFHRMSEEYRVHLKNITFTSFS